MYCKNCGKEINDNAFVCPACGVRTGVNNVSQEDGPIGGLGIICFLFPLIGLILYLVWKDTKPIKAKGAGTAALWGFIIGIILVIISSVGMCSGGYY